MKKVIAIHILFLLMVGALVVYGQQKSAATSTPEKIIEIGGEDYKMLRATQRDLRNAQLEAENLQLRIEQAQRQLSDLQKKAADEQERWKVQLSQLAKLPKESLSEYMIIDRDGKFTLMKSPKQP